MATPRVIDIGRGNISFLITGVRRGANELISRLAKRGKELIEKSFQVGGLPGFKWKPLSSATLLLRAEGGFTGSRILVKSTKMESSAFATQTGENQWEAGIEDDKAMIHEFGAVVKVTDAMRVYLHSQGIHLSARKKKIIIPARPTVRAAAEHLDREYDKIYNDTFGLLTRIRFKVGAWFG